MCLQAVLCGPSLGPLHWAICMSQAPVFVSGSRTLFLLDIACGPVYCGQFLEMPWLPRGHLCWLFFPLVKSLEKLPQPLLLVNWIGGQNKNRTQNPAVMESKAVLFTTQQPSKWGDELCTEQQLYSESQQMETRAGQSPKSVLLT